MPARLPKEKLRLLYLLQCCNCPISAEELLEFCGDWLPFFSLQTTVFSLSDAGLIRPVVPVAGDRRYLITEAGRAALNEFKVNIPLSERESLQALSVPLAAKARTASTYPTAYHKQANGQYMVNLYILEQGSALLSLQMIAASMDQAESICRAWPARAPKIYASLFS
ncbi:MAG: DUF4364 family protein [Clostridia bacterium]|nr:DUF4364 family protein [Clostridia bacterium]